MLVKNVFTSIITIIVGLAIIQTAGFIHGIILSEYADTTPLWVSVSLIFLTAAGILMGDNLQSKRVK